MIGIYKISSPSNKIYIGQSLNIKKRWSVYLTLNCKSQIHLYNSFLKHGVENHKFEIISCCIPEDLDKLEKYYIDLFQTFNSENGLNLRDGGGRTGRHSIETKLKMSLSSKGKKKTIQHRASMSKRMKGGISPMLNKKHSQETKDKIRAYVKSNPNRHWLNKKRDEKTKKIMTENGKRQFSKKVLNTSTGIIYPSIADACVALNYKRENVYNYFRRIRNNVKIRDKNKLTLIYINT